LPSMSFHAHAAHFFFNLIKRRQYQTLEAK
jgi:hypothetical protein